MRRKLWIFCSLLLCCGLSVAQPAPPVAGRPWLDRARQVGWWLRSLEAEHGHVPVDALTPDARRDDLASGRAGQLLFWLALHRATGEYEALAAMQRVADGLVAELPNALPDQEFPPPGSYYYGLAGVAWALDLAARESGNPVYADAARRAVQTLIDSARNDEDGRPYWDDRFDELLFGNTGISLFMLYAASEMRVEDALRVARAQGDRLIQRANRHEGGLSWPMRWDRPEMELPNFTHGAAGIGYFLATLSMMSGERSYLEAAQGAAQHLRTIARRDLGGITFPYGYGNPNWDGVVEIGWAHGVSGTARLFQRLHQMTGEPSMDSTVEDCAAAILRSNAPYEPSPGFESEFPLSRRFGLAGVAEFLISRFRQTAEELYLAQAQDIARHIHEAALPEQVGLVWETPRPAFAENPGEPARYTGYLTGAIGYGLLFLKLDAAIGGSLDPVPSLDDPYAFVPVKSH